MTSPTDTHLIARSMSSWVSSLNRKGCFKFISPHLGIQKYNNHAAFVNNLFSLQDMSQKNRTHISWYPLNTTINYIMEITMPPVNSVISLFMFKVIFAIITKSSRRKLCSSHLQSVSQVRDVMKFLNCFIY